MSHKEVTHGAIWEPTYLCLISPKENIIRALNKAFINITSNHAPKTIGTYVLVI